MEGIGEGTFHLYLLYTNAIEIKALSLPAMLNNLCCKNKAT